MLNDPEFTIWLEFFSKIMLQVEILFAQFQSRCIEATTAQSYVNKFILNNILSYFIDRLKAVSSNFTLRNKESKYVSVPAWNLKCKELYRAREVFFVWKNSCRIRDGSNYFAIRSARCNFKNA